MPHLIHSIAQIGERRGVERGPRSGDFWGRGQPTWPDSARIGTCSAKNQSPHDAKRTCLGNHQLCELCVYREASQRQQWGGGAHLQQSHQHMLERDSCRWALLRLLYKRWPSFLKIVYTEWSPCKNIAAGDPFLVSADCSIQPPHGLKPNSFSHKLVVYLEECTWMHPQ